jgi:hypothetical protein
MPVARGDLVPLLSRAIVRHLACATLAADDRKPIAGLRRPAETQNFDRHRGPCAVDRRAGVGDERAHPAPLGAGDDDVATT